MSDTNPAFIQWVPMIKDGEEKLVHPGNVENHKRAGWTVQGISVSVAADLPAPEPLPVEDAKTESKSAKKKAPKTTDPNA